MLTLATAAVAVAFFLVGIVAGVLIGRKNKEHVEAAYKSVIDYYEEVIAKMDEEADALKAKITKKKVVK